MGQGGIDLGDKRFENRLILRQGIAIGGDDNLLKFRRAAQNHPDVALDEFLEVLVRERA